nr:LodA/GoxA family CTQ-dependent oxidase [Paraflavitalea speifideiaquila]
MDDEGNPLGEIYTGIEGLEVKIEWTVHIANRKAAWYQFNNALDLGANSISSTHRNGGVTGTDRSNLVIDPGPRTITGVSKEGAEYQFNTGTFLIRLYRWAKYVRTARAACWYLAVTAKAFPALAFPPSLLPTMMAGMMTYLTER